MKFPTNLRYLLLQCFGLKLPNEYEEQVIKRIKYWLQHTDANTVAVYLPRINMEQSQLEAGVDTYMLQLLFKNYGCLVTVTWVRTLWKFVDKYGISLDMSERVILPLLWEGDEYFTVWLLSLGFSEENTSQQNISRLFHHDIPRMDIIIGDCRRI